MLQSLKLKFSILRNHLVLPAIFTFLGYFSIILVFIYSYNSNAGFQGRLLEVITALALSLTFFYLANKKYKQSICQKFQRDWESNNYDKTKYTKAFLKGLRSDADFLKDYLNPDYSLDDETFRDLNLENLFQEIDITKTSMGESFLYFLLQNSNSTIAELKLRDQYQNDLIKIANVRKNLVSFLQRIGKNPYFSLRTIYNFKQLYNRKLLFISYLLFSLLSFTVIGRIIYSSEIFSGMIVLFLLTNSAFYYFLKFKLELPLKNLIYLRHIFLIVYQEKKLNKDRYFQLISAEDRKFIRSFLVKSYFLDRISLNPNPLSYFLKEYENMFLLNRVRVFYRTVNFLNKHQTQTFKVIRLIGLMDSQLSAAAFKKKFPVSCKPKFSENATLNFTNIIHPLLKDPVANNFTLSKSGIFITGSNMSGKTTFIRTIGINLVLAQSFGFVFAREFESSFFKIMSTFSLSDDLLLGKSYYFAEAERILRVIREAEKDHQKCLCLLDEILKGTNSSEKHLATKGIISYLIKQNSLVFVTTHDLDLTTELKSEFDTYHFTDTFKDNNLIFDYKINQGVSYKTNALKLMKTMNYPEAVFNVTL